MAAIFGIIARDGGLDLEASAARLQERLAYRAPDGFAFWKGDGCLLAHGALHLDPAAVHTAQPLRLRDGRICVADAYVANVDEVRAALGIDASMPLDDAQLLALAIERWDVRFTDHVRGEFAAAVWNPRTRELQLFRDHLGGRPVCYTQTPKLFAFASTDAALTALPGVGARLDPSRYVTLWFDDAHYLGTNPTAFEGIHALPPAHQLAWAEKNGEAAPQRYWRNRPCPPTPYRDPHECVEAFRAVFGRAVANAMRGSTNTALMLSGGIDSGAILAARRGFRSGGVANDLMCVSAILGTHTDDRGIEEENANILAMTASHPRRLQFTVPVDDAPGSRVTHADLAEAALGNMHPVDMSMLVPSLSCRLAREAGCRLILNGTDGDNVMTPRTGLNYMAGLVGEGKLIRAWLECVKAARVNTYLRGQSPLRLFLHALIPSLQPGFVRRWRNQRQTERVIRGLGAHAEMAPSLAVLTDLARRLRAASRRRTGEFRQLRSDHRAWWMGFSLYGSESIVSRHGMEIRHPWCDLRVLDFFERLPVAYQAREGWTKWVARKACEDALGAAVWHSGKRHLGALLNQQVLEDAAPYLRQLLAEQRPRLLDFYREAAIIDAIRYLSEPKVANTASCDIVLTMAALAGWIRHAREQLDNGG
jgi:asparagine synthase (glutamine-hydrolysing)